MPQDKAEIVRHVNEMITRLKNGDTTPGGFAEITIGAGVEPVQAEPLSQRIPPPDPDRERKRSLFVQMRELSKTSGYFSDSGLQAAQFYNQGKFMERFEDDFEESVPFSLYFPSYQQMGYEQLRTYFTWRGKVRRGVVEQTSLSYVFVYLYELLNNIGAAPGFDGLEKLIFLWQAYRVFEKKLDRYLTGWVRDYFITKDFPCSFRELLSRYDFLRPFYEPLPQDSPFELYASLSDYKFTKSIFYTEERGAFLRQCFNRAVELLNALLAQGGGSFEDLIFYGRKGSLWKPFEKALYFSGADRPKNHRAQRTVKLSEAEVYWYDNGKWACSKNRIHRESGRRLIGYLFRRLEVLYRKSTGFSYKISADRSKVSTAELARFTEPDRFFACVDEAFIACDREARRVSVTVNPAQLEKIREKARITQEKLTVAAAADDTEPSVAETAPTAEPEPLPSAKPADPTPLALFPTPAADSAAVPPTDPWQALADSLTPAQAGAVRLLLDGSGTAQLESLARQHGLMPEVLLDGLNEKALDLVGDSICELTDTVLLFEEYRKELERVLC